MIKMLAIKDVPSCVGVIPAGAEFWEPNPENQNVWERSGVARVLDKPARPAWDHTEWSGFTVAIIASGPSLTAAQCELVHAWRSDANNAGRRVIAVNTSFERAPFADIVYGCDRRWWDVHFPKLKEQFRPEQLWTQQEGGEPLVNSVRSIRGAGLSKTRGVIHQGANSGYQAIGLAVMWGAKKIILLGFDCRGAHWHGEHPSPLNVALPFQMWLQAFATLPRDLDAAGVEIINCSPGSALKVFPQRKLEDVIPCSPSATLSPTPTTGAKPSSMDFGAPATGSSKTQPRIRGATFSSSGTGTE